MAVTIRDVAKLSGVSVATVSRVINQISTVNPETQKRVRKAMEQLNYEPNQVAQGLASKKTQTIALVLPNISNPFFSDIVRAVEDVAQSNGFTVILCNSDGLVSKEQSYIEVLRKKYIDGIVFASNTLRQEDFEKMKKDNISIVVLDYSSSTDSCSIVRAKNREGARMAVHHLLEIGCGKIAHIYGPLDDQTARNRLDGYEEIVHSFSWYSPTLLVPGQFTINGGIEATKMLLEKHPDVDGIFAGNDLMAVGVLKALHQMGKKVPEDVAVCGFDGIYLTEITQPELTTVAQPIYKMGEKAAKILINKINGLLEEDSIYELDVSLIKRESTIKIY
ncbi:LacI family DNA-binding transcriptional regulator [Bacillus sp. S/N-304-OC-R1]|uniref:LacI family DNA-binding transcriptional regulator n=1 Tax=Bacillus sp. S/N-304-OC-R1 TaxID=2758034 RepID=UPI001C8E48FC|nr:LacI family DNA-binding transcriptional regulator [Bacillus sp. S/N-304-OC-R1]MBY0122920.1 LacI family DNA-binding transcriptional regulator [Bacillus sp. S/N-304-OC-R1]